MADIISKFRDKDAVLFAEVDKLKSGKAESFNTIYDLSKNYVYKIIWDIVKNQDAADDIMQDTYVNVYRSAGIYKDSGNPMAWIMKISKNLFLMERRKSKHTVLSLSEQDENTVSLSFDSVSDVEVRMFLENLFSKVSEEERNIAVLHVMGGFKHREIAELLDLPVGTVLSKYNRVMKKLNALAIAGETNGQ